MIFSFTLSEERKRQLKKDRKDEGGWTRIFPSRLGNDSHVR